MEFFHKKDKASQLSKEEEKNKKWEEHHVFNKTRTQYQKDVEGLAEEAELVQPIVESEEKTDSNKENQ